MILPFITPSDGVVLNLATMTRWAEFTNDRGELSVEIEFADNDIPIRFDGTPAEIIKAEIIFAVNTYRAFQKGISATADKPLIVPPDFTGGRVN